MRQVNDGEKAEGSFRDDSEKLVASHQRCMKRNDLLCTHFFPVGTSGVWVYDSTS